MITLRPYQDDAKNAVYEHLRTREDNPCAVVPTAGGKTPIMASICKDVICQWDGRVLILAHVKELLEQTAHKLHNVCPQVGFGIYSAGHCHLEPPEAAELVLAFAPLDAEEIAEGVARLARLV